MEPEGSLPHSQQPSACPNPEPDQSSQYLPSYLSQIHLNIIHPPTTGFPSGFFCSGFSTNNLHAVLLPIRATCLAHSNYTCQRDKLRNSPPTSAGSRNLGFIDPCVIRLHVAQTMSSLTTPRNGWVTNPWIQVKRSNLSIFPVFWPIYIYIYVSIL
jgi:hypothetical protein